MGNTKNYKQVRDTRVFARIDKDLYRKCLSELKRRKWTMSSLIEEALIEKLSA